MNRDGLSLPSWASESPRPKARSPMQSATPNYDGDRRRLVRLGRTIPRESERAAAARGHCRTRVNCERGAKGSTCACRASSRHSTSRALNVPPILRQVKTLNKVPYVAVALPGGGVPCGVSASERDSMLCSRSMTGNGSGRNDPLEGTFPLANA